MIVVLSDLHLGLPRAPEPPALAPLFDGATRVVLNGDSTELSTASFARRAAHELERLRAVVAAAGAECAVIAGNHDPDIAPRLHEDLMDSQVLATHGHAFHPMIVPWSRHARAVARRHAEAFAAAAALPPLERALHAAAEAARVERALDAAQTPPAEVASMCLRPWVSVQIVAYWRIFPELAVRFRDAFAPRARVVICGHSHRAGAWWHRGCLVLNTGCFTFPGTPHAVLLEEDEIVLVPLERRRGEWRYMAEARRAWRMGAIADAARSARMPVP
jgi:predicted phosphodiesterase